MTGRLPGETQTLRFGASCRAVTAVAGDTGGATSPAQRDTSMGLPATSPGLLDRATAARPRRACALPARADADGDDPGRARVRAAGRRATAAWAASPRGSGPRSSSSRCVGLRARGVAPPVRVLVRLRHHRAGLPAPGPDGARDRLGRPSSSTRGGSGSRCRSSLTHRRAVVGLNGVLCFSVAGTLLFGAHLVGVQRDFILTMFSGDTVHRPARRALQRAARRRRLRRRALGAADRLDDRRQHRRRAPARPC